MLIVSFATANTPYVQVLKDFLLPSLKKFNIVHDIVYPEDRGSWVLNTQLKPTIIRDMLLKHKQPIVFLDADATIEYYPELFDTLEKLEADVGVHYLDWNKLWKGIEGNLKREIGGGTLYFNYNEKVLTFIDKWIALNIDDQKGLNILLPKETDLKIYSLPIEYCAICKTNTVPEWIINPIIVHHQASRKYRGYRK